MIILNCSSARWLSGARLAGLLIPLTGTFATGYCAKQAPSVPYSSRKDPATLCGHIIYRMQHDHILSSADRHYIIETAGAPKLETAIHGLLALEEGVETKLFDLDAFLKIAERMLIAGADLAPISYLQVCSNTLGASGGSSPDFDQLRNLIQEKLPLGSGRTLNKISDAQWVAARRILRSANRKARSAAATLFVCCKGLSSSDTKGLLEAVNAQLGSANGGIRTYWRLVKRVVLRKNPNPA